MYVVALKELMSQASPGKPPRQAPRFPTILLAAFEDVVLSDDKPVFLRVLVAFGAILGYFEVRRSSWATASRVRCDFYGSTGQAHQVESFWLGQAPQFQNSHHSSFGVHST